MRVTVLGAGVSGLSSAVALQEAGHDVLVVAAAKGVATTSGAAGAVWYPFRADPPDRVNAWATRTREYLAHLAATDPDAGVDVLTLWELVDSEETPWWLSSAGAVRLVSLNDGTPFPLPSRFAWVFSAPRLVPAIHLAWLESQLARPVQIGVVESFEDLAGDVVVNCTGLGARQLCRDAELMAVFGQTVVVRGGSFDPAIVVSDERDIDEMFYAIPRRDEILIGGCAIDCEDNRDLAPGPELRDAILGRARKLGFDPGTVVSERCGLRPYRSTVRVERDGHVIHNYGHGGAGYTLARGCAEEVVRLVAAVE